MSLSLIVPHGQTHRLTLTHTRADTLQAPASLRAADPPLMNALTIPPAPEAVYRAHEQPRATTSSTHPCLRNGTLLLVGGGAGQQDLSVRFLALAGGPAAKVIDWPDAAMARKGTTLPPDGSAVASLLSTSHVDVPHAGSRDLADSEAFVRPLRTATAVCIDGGNMEALVDRYTGGNAERAPAPRISPSQAGRMFWFIWNRFCGSYFALSFASRS